MLPLASSSSSNEEEIEGDDHDFHTMRGELAVARQSLWDGCHEIERLKECLAVAETMLNAMDQEVADARATVMVTRTKLISELNFFASIVELHVILILIVHVS